MAIIQGTSKAAGGAGYTINQSIRFNKTDNSGLTVTPSAGNRDLFTLSVWFKLGLVTSTEYRTLFCADTSNTFQISFLPTANGDYLRFQDNGVRIFDFSQSLRDPSAWYHLVYAYDSAQATASDRCTAYLNGEEVTDLTGVAYPAQNVDSKWNSAVVHGLGYRSATDNWDGYLAEIHHIEGAALDPTSFGETNDDGVWIPKAYDGSYGTNGFYITGEDSTFLGQDVRTSGDQVNSFQASQYTGAPSDYTFSDGRVEADTSNRAIRTVDTFTGDFEFTWRYVNMANFVIGLYEIDEDATFSSTSSAGNMQNMTDSWYVQTSSVSANRDIKYGSTTVVNATTIANGDVWKMTRESGTIKVYRNGSLIHTYAQTSTNEVRLVIAQGDAAADANQIAWVDNSTLGNNFFSSGLATTDQMLDTPTLNFSTFNPLNVDAYTLSDGNLNTGAAGDAGAVSTFAIDVTDSNGFYFEVASSTAATYPDIGLQDADALALAGATTISAYNTGRYTYQGNTGNFNDQGSTSSYGTTYTTNTIGVLVQSGNLYFSKDGVIQNSGTAAKTGLTGMMYARVSYSAGSGTHANFTINFGQSAFTHDPGSTYKAWNTANLPNPTIALPEKYFNTVLYEGNGGGQRVGQFQPITETYSVPNSVIINNADSAYLEKTFSTSESTLTAWSFSAWVKRSLLADEQWLFTAGTTSANLEYLRFTNSDTLEYKLILSSSVDANYITNQVFKDTSSWMHIYSYRSSTTFKLYINGTEVTAFSTSNAPGSSDGMFGKNVRHRIGTAYSTPSNFLGAYLAEVNFIPGTAQVVSDFGQLDASTNRWIPKDTSGLTFGTNGFYLDFGSGKESTSSATTTNMNATQFVNGSMGSWGTGDTAYDFTGGTADRNINTGTSFIASSTDFDFYGTLSAVASTNAPFLGWYTSGTNTNAGTPSTTASAGIYARNGNSTGVYSGWLLLNSTREAARTNKSWEFQRKVGVHRRGSQLYGSLDGRIDHKYSSTPSTTSAGGLFLGNSGDGTSYTWSDVHSITYSSTTQNQYGLDSSGNGNNFTGEGTWDFLGGGNLSYDTPTRNSLGFWDGEFETGSTETVPSFGNTKINTSTGNDVGTPSRGFVSSGKWYYEIDVLTVYNGTGSSAYAAYGIVDYDSYGDTYDATGSGSLDYGGKVVAWKSDGAKLDESSNTASVFSTVSAGDVIQIALDMDNGAVWFGKNNTWELSATASEIENGDTSNAVRIGLTGEWSPVFHRWTGTEHVEINAGSAFRFGDSELSLDTASGGYFKYTPPDGFKSLNNDNLPLSNGDLSAFVWIKNRDAADNHMLFDAVRGATKDLHSNSTAAEVTNANTLTRFLKNGFEVSNNAEVNTSGESYVAWQWLNDSLTTSSNTDGDITSTVSANTTAGFSIATYTGNASSSQTIGHGLGQIPSLVMFKELDSSSYSWQVYHASLGYTQRLILDDTTAAVSATNIFSAAPTSTVFTIGNSAGINTNSASHVMYSFAEIPGYSSFGSYTGNGSTNGPFVYTGFKPRFIMFKRTNTTESWTMLDTARGSGNFGSLAGSGGDNPTAGNEMNANIRANTSAVEEDNVGGSRKASFLSNGFKVRNTNTAMNASGSTYIYMAFAEHPFGGGGVAPATAR